MNLHLSVGTAIRMIAQRGGHAAIRISNLNMLSTLIVSERDCLRRIHKFRNCVIVSGHHDFTDIANQKLN